MEEAPDAWFDADGRRDRIFEQIAKSDLPHRFLATAHKGFLQGADADLDLSVMEMMIDAGCDAFISFLGQSMLSKKHAFAVEYGFAAHDAALRLHGAPVRAAGRSLLEASAQTIWIAAAGSDQERCDRILRLLRRFVTRKQAEYPDWPGVADVLRAADQLPAAPDFSKRKAYAPQSELARVAGADYAATALAQYDHASEALHAGEGGPSWISGYSFAEGRGLSLSIRPDPPPYVAVGYTWAVERGAETTRALAAIGDPKNRDRIDQQATELIEAAQALRERMRRKLREPETWNPLPPVPDVEGQEGPRNTRARSRPGRNEPCSCGSGVKFKRCCGA